MLLFPGRLPAACPPGDSSFHLVGWLNATETAFRVIRQERRQVEGACRFRLTELNKALALPAALDPVQGYPLLLEKTRLEEELRRLEVETDLKTLRLRYRKSIEVLRILYEKILSMDHHFTSLRTNQQVLRISNPHEYPEFKEVKTQWDERLKKKYNFALPGLLEGNPYLSAVYSILGLALGGGNERLDKSHLDKIACILDFTVRMHQDLNLICYETEYLRDGNLTLKTACENLFNECTRQVGYAIPLPVCRDSDDWERLYSQLDNYVDRNLDPALATNAMQKRAFANLQFAVDRVVHFIERYCSFVTQGNEYYKKFARIVDGYDNEANCNGALPESFSQLKTDIGVTLEKFNSAYNLPEIQGSRLKDLLYGIGE